MTIRKYNLSLDVKNQSYAPQIITRQGDATGTTQLNVAITDNGAPVTFTGTPQFRALTSISKLVVVDSNNFSNINANQGTFTYGIPSQVLAEPGRLYVAYFAITDSSGVESTVGLTVFVQQAADLNPAHYGDYVSTIDGVIKSTQESITDLKQKIAEAQATWASGNFVSITTNQTISGVKTFTAPINGALATRNTHTGGFTDFTEVAKNMVLWAGNWGFSGSEMPANGPDVLSNTPYGVIEVIPNHPTDGVIRISIYPSQMLYETTVDNGVLKGWQRVATDADIGSVNSSIAAVNASIAAGAAVTADTGYTSMGVTPVNSASGTTMNYRTYSFGSKHITEINGYIKLGAQLTTEQVQVLKLPTAVFPGGLSEDHVIVTNSPAKDLAFVTVKTDQVQINAPSSAIASGTAFHFMATITS